MKTQKLHNGFVYFKGEPIKIEWQYRDAEEGYLCIKSPTNDYGYSTGEQEYPAFRPKITAEPGVTYLKKIRVDRENNLAYIESIKPYHVPVN